MRGRAAGQGEQEVRLRVGDAAAGFERRGGVGSQGNDDLQVVLGTPCADICRVHAFLLVVADRHRDPQGLPVDDGHQHVAGTRIRGNRFRGRDMGIDADRQVMQGRRRLGWRRQRRFDGQGLDQRPPQHQLQQCGFIPGAANPVRNTGSGVPAAE